MRIYRFLCAACLPTIVAISLLSVAESAPGDGKPTAAPILLNPEPVTQGVTTKIDLLALIREGRVEYHINPHADFKDDAKDIFTFDDAGVLHISGRGYGGVTTLDSFRDYHLVIEFKWGEKTWGRREHASRDSGILVHCWGPQGAHGGTWMAGLEAQIIEGGVGDLLVLSPTLANGTTFFCSVSAETGIDSNEQPIWSPGAARRTMSSGRLNWRHRAADWKDVKGFRGTDDVESPPGEWTRLEVVAQGDTLRYFVNGVKVNEVFECRPSQGRILLQTEGAEMVVRRYELHPLGQFERK